MNHYEHKGYKYDPMEDVEPGENCKIFHLVKTPEGTTVHMDWSPYSTPTEEDFKLWIDIGMPNRYDQGLGERQCYGSLSRNDLLTIQAKGGAKPGNDPLFPTRH